MLVTPLAAESMGARSMATWVETRDCRIIIDPWLEELPLRFGLEPHPVELWYTEKLQSRIRLFLRKAEVIIITRYDHATLSLLSPEMCKDRTIFMRNPNQHTNLEHRNTVFEFIKENRSPASEISFVEGRLLKLGKTKLHFSTSVEGVPGAGKGYVMPLAIEDRKQCFFYSSEIAGHFGSHLKQFFTRMEPDTCLLDGPETTWRKHGRELGDLDGLIQEYMELMLAGPLKVLITDHHLLRDINWRLKATRMFKMAEKSRLVIKTAAEFRGEENNLLEARRDQLYEVEPPK